MTKKKFSVSINSKWCKNCGICAYVCPTKVFAFNSLLEMQVVDENKCIGCSMCELHCPDFAITVTKKIEVNK